MNSPGRFIEANERVGEPDLVRSGGAQLSGFGVSNGPARLPLRASPHALLTTSGDPP
jgi:hypothetical protein